MEKKMYWNCNEVDDGTAVSLRQVWSVNGRECDAHKVDGEAKYGNRHGDLELSNDPHQSRRIGSEAKCTRVAKVRYNLGLPPRYILTQQRRRTMQPLKCIAFYGGASLLDSLDHRGEDYGQQADPAFSASF
jgi:hypothetical protein